jgi:hypothetical protein
MRLESVIRQLHNSEEYAKIETIVKQQVNKIFGDDKQLLEAAFESITESFLKDPFRLQSHIEYAMSSASTSTVSYGINDNMERKMEWKWEDETGGWQVSA